MSEQTFTTLEAEFLAGYVFGRVIEFMGGVFPGQHKLTEEQERALHAMIDEGMQYLGKKTSIELEMQAEMDQLLEGER